jgi:hypothetical protein
VKRLWPYLRPFAFVIAVFLALVLALLIAFPPKLPGNVYRYDPWITIEEFERRWDEDASVEFYEPQEHLRKANGKWLDTEPGEKLGFYSGFDNTVAVFLREKSGRMYVCRAVIINRH